MDELKAFLLVAAVGVRLWLGRGDPLWLLEGLVGLVAVAAAISLTTFMRRPEYGAATAPPQPGAGDYGDGFAAAPRRAGHAASGSARAIPDSLPELPSGWPSSIAWTCSCTFTWRSTPLTRRGRCSASCASWEAPAMKAIIVAAGRGRRLGNETDEIPKCMVLGRRPVDPPLAAARPPPPGSTTWCWSAAIAAIASHRPGHARPLRREPGLGGEQHPRFPVLRERRDARAASSSRIRTSSSRPRHARAGATAGPDRLLVDRRWDDAYEGRTLHPVAKPSWRGSGDGAGDG